MTLAGQLNATFYAFSKRQPGGVLLGASICYTLMIVALSAATFALFVPAMGLNIFDPSVAAAPPNPTAALWMLPAAFTFAFAYCVITASFEAACLRWMIRGERPGLFGMTLDEDTWRVYGLYWIWLLCYAVVWIGGLILSALVSRLLPDNQIALFAVLGIYALAIAFGAVSLAPAAAVTIALKRFTFGEATEATDGRFLPLLGAFSILILLQWLLNNGATFAWLLWALDGDISPYLANARDLMTSFTAYNEAVAAAMGAPNAVEVYWAMSAALLVSSTMFLVLLYGVNARVARVALEQGQISTAPSEG